MASPSNSSQNGGILGVNNKTSFGKCTVTSVTATGCLTLQPGTGIVKAAIISGGGGGGKDRAAGGGAGGLLNQQINLASTGGSVPIVVGAGGAGAGPPTAPGSDGAVSTLILQVLLVAVVEQDQVLSVMLAVQVVAVVELIHVIQVLLVEQVHHVKVMLEEPGLTQAQVELLQMQEGLVVAAVLVL